MRDYEKTAKMIDKAFDRPDLTSEDILNLTIAQRLNTISDDGFTKALGGRDGVVISQRRKFL